MSGAEIEALLGEGLRLMAVGMGIVFIFLLLLIAVLRAMSWLAGRLAPIEARHHDAATGLVAPTLDESDAALLAVIAAAIARYRAGRTIPTR